MGLMEEIGRGPVALDTVVFIYFMEEHPRYLGLVEPIFRTIDRGKVRGFSSGLTLLECLVVPYRAGDMELAERYIALLTKSRGLTLVALDHGVLRAAAYLRAALGLKTPDALQIAAALNAKAKVFVTNDRRLPTLKGLRVIQLDDYLTTPGPS